MRLWAKIGGLLSLSCAIAFAEPGDSVEAPSCSEELIHLLTENRFNSDTGHSVRRELSEYAFRFGPECQNFLLSLTGSSHVMDLGAGSAIAARQLAGALPLEPSTFAVVNTIRSWASSRRPKVSAVSFVMPEDAKIETENYAPFYDRFFEAIPDEELVARFGKLDGSFDFWGGSRLHRASGRGAL